MKKLYAVFVTVALAFTFVGLGVSPAAAAKPLVFEDERFDDTFIIPAGEICDFDVQLRSQVKVRTTVFFDRDGQTRQAVVHVNGTESWSLPGGEVVLFDRWTNNVTILLAPGSDENTPPLGIRESGNPWNLHAGPGGVLINDSGHLEFDENFEPVVIRGPHDALLGDPSEVICGELAASAG